MTGDRLQRRLCSALTAHLNTSGRPDVPAGGELLWSWFVDLSASRSWGMTAPNPITMGEIDAYRRLTGWPIEDRHIRVLRAMDEAFRRHFEAPTAPAAKASRPLTAAVFDAVFG